MTAEEFFVPGELYRWLGDSEIYLVLALDLAEGKTDSRKFWDSHIAVQFLACDGYVFWRTSSRRAEVLDGKCSNFVKVT
jgi:hypothetical protein